MPTSPIYTTVQRRVLGDYLLCVARLLELADWRVILCDEHVESPNAAASMKVIFGRKLGELRLAKDFWDNDLEHIEHYLIHEMCHLLSDPLDSVIEGGVEILIGKPAFTVLSEQWTVQLEIMTDTLAYAFQYLMSGGPEYDRLLQAIDCVRLGELPPPEAGTARSAPVA